jgi:hypothetical protein
MPRQKKQTAGGQGKRGGKRKGMCLEDRPILEPNAAGIDIGAREIYVVVPRTGMSSRCGYSQPSPKICRRWPSGW